MRGHLQPLLRIRTSTKGDKWKKLPPGWTEESVKKFWGSVAGDAKHKVTKCIEKMEGNVDDPGAFCASLKDRMEGTSWRHEPRKKKAAERVAQRWVMRVAQRQVVGFNKYNPTELLGQLLSVLESKGLRDVARTIRQHKIPQLVNDAWLDSKGMSADELSLRRGIV